MDVANPQQDMFEALLDPNEAMTIAVRVQLSPSIVDTRIVAATPPAATLYGYQDPRDLAGKFTSMMHVLEDIQRTRLRSTLRALGLVEALERYEVRILPQSGPPTRVIKEVEQRQVAQTMVWICRLEPADPHRPFHPPPVPETVPEHALHAYFGWACVAEIETVLRQQQFWLTSLPQTSIFSHIPSTVAGAPEETLPVAPSPVARVALCSPRTYYRYRCFVCGREWIGGGQEVSDDAQTPLPLRCNYADCRAYAWHDPVAALVARRKREHRRVRHRQCPPSLPS